MTEAEWLAATDATPMFEYVRENIRVGRAEGRKDYLLAAAAGQWIWHLVEDVRIRHAIEWMEAFADDADYHVERSEVANGVMLASGEISGAAHGGDCERYAGEFEVVRAVAQVIWWKLPRGAA